MRTVPTTTHHPTNGCCVFARGVGCHMTATAVGVGVGFSCGTVWPCVVCVGRPVNPSRWSCTIKMPVQWSQQLVYPHVPLSKKEWGTGLELYHLDVIMTSSALFALYRSMEYGVVSYHHILTIYCTCVGPHQQSVTLSPTRPPPYISADACKDHIMPISFGHLFGVRWDVKPLCMLFVYPSHRPVVARVRPNVRIMCVVQCVYTGEMCAVDVV